MKLLVLMWLLLQPSSTPLKERSLAYSMNMPTLGRDHQFIHQVNLNSLRPMLMKNLSKLVVPNLSLLWMDILSLFSSRMVWPMPHPFGRPTDQDMDTYPHVFFTSAADEWDPSVLDHDPPHLDGLDPSQVPDQPFGDPMFDAYLISMSASLPTSTPSWMHLQKIVGHTQKSPSEFTPRA